MTDDLISIDVSVDRLFASHIGIFGNTGSGKSHTLATLYKNLFQKFGKQKAFRKNGRFILFDFNGEYSNETSVTPLKKVYNLSTKSDQADKIQLSSEDILTPEIFFILASATEKTQQPFIRRALKLYGKAQEARDPLEYTKGILRNKLKQILKLSNGALADLTLGYLESILDSREDLRSNLGWHSDQRCFYIRRTQSNSFFYFNNSNWETGVPEIKHWQAIDLLEKDEDFISWITKCLYIQLIDDVLSNRAQNEHVAPAINKLKSLSKEFTKVFSISTDEGSAKLWEEGKPLAVINMDKVSTSMKKLIPLLLSYKYYQEHKGKKSAEVTSSLNIIIDEAHNILSYDSTRESQEWKDFRLETFEEIIKEGRKFGVFLTIASQRPSDISATIISQLHNYLIHRLINNKDLEMVDKAIAYLDKISIESLPILPPGACVLSGIIADLPLILQVDRLKKEEQPESQTIALTASWVDKPEETKEPTAVEEDKTAADTSSTDFDVPPF